jgi:hypothetical protein
MANYLKYDFTNKNSNVPTNIVTCDTSKIKPNSKVNHQIEKKTNTNNVFFLPKEQDTLFWSYYIISFGLTSYEMLNCRNSLMATQIKIDLVQKLRTNKSILKMYKYDTLINMESNLVNEQIIDIKTFMSLLAIDNINVIYVKGKTYYELLFNQETPVYIIREKEIGTKYVKKYGFEIGNTNIIEQIKTTLYKIDKLDKPIKSLSSYKVQELIDICEKLCIEIKQTGKNKHKTKNELYEAIVQYF